MTKNLRRKFLICLCLLVLPLFVSSRVFLAGYQKYNHFFHFTLPLQNSGLVLTGPDRDPNPVINEGKQVQLSLLNSSGQMVTGATFSSDSPDIANVDPQTGMVAGLQRGYATITARMGSQGVSTFVVVTRVNNSSGVKVPGDAKVDNQGAIYLSDPTNNVIYKKMNTNADAQIFAGKLGSRGKNDGERSQALFAGPTAIAIDNRPQGGTYIADTLNHSIRRVGFDDQVATIIGNGSPGMNTNDVTPFDQATFNSPQGVAVDQGGNVYIADTANHAIYVADFNKKQIRLIAGQPGSAGKADATGRAAMFNRPTAISLQSSNNSFFGSQQPVLLVADTGNGRIRAVSLDGKVKTIGPIKQTSAQDISVLADNEFEFSEPTSISVDAVGNIYVVDKLGAKLITDNPSQRQMVSLAQPGVSFGQATSIVVRGNQTLVLDKNASSDKEAVKVVTIGAPQIINMTQDSDKLQGGTEITVIGKNFAPESDIILGDTVIGASIDSSTRLRFIVPSQQAPGIRTLSIRTRGGVVQRPFRVFADPFQDLVGGRITTFAGGIPFLGDGGDALVASLNRPEGVVVDGSGNIFVADTSNHRIRMIDPSGVITTVAGNGIRGFSGDGSLALAASINAPRSIALDSSGNLFIADFGNSRIRRVDAITGIITTVVGNGGRIFAGDGGAATSASLRFPQGVVIDNTGNILIADTGNARVRRVDSQTGVITTIAGNGNKTIDQDGGMATSTAIGAVEVVAVDNSNNVFFLSSASGRIRQITNSQTITTVAGDGTKGFAGDGGSATAAKLNSPEDFKIDSLGNILISDSANGRIRRVDAKTGIITTVAGSGTLAFGGDGAIATTASINLPKGIAVDGLGNLVISDTANNRIRRITTDGIINSVAGNGTNSFTTKGSVMDTRFDYPEAMAVQDGTIYIADTFNNRVVVIDVNNGVADTIAGNDDIDPTLGDDNVGEEFGDDDGSNSDNDDGDGGNGDDSGGGDDGGGGSGGGGGGGGGDDGGDDGINTLVDSALDINLRFPSGIVVDKNSLYISDTGNSIIQKVDLATGVISVFAGTGTSGFSGDGAMATTARLNSPHGLALDGDGNLYVADSDNRRIRRIDKAGIITTIAGTGMLGSAGDGGMAKAAQFVFPRALTFDSKGNLYVVDSDDSRIRKIDTTGVISTIAGNGRDDFSGDGGAATSASLKLPKGVVVDNAGNIFISDSENERIRRVDGQTGIITTIAGTGVTGFSGDGDLAAQAKLNNPHSLALDNNNNLFVLDTFNNSIRVMKLSGSNANTPDFSLNVSPVSQNVQVGSSAKFNISFTGLNGFNSPVALATSLLPSNSGVSLNLSSSSVNSGQMSTLTVNVSSNVSPGVFNIAVNGQALGLTRQEMIRLVVTPKPAGDFVIAVRPGVQTVALGSATSFTINSQAINDFSGSLALAATIDPPNNDLRLTFSSSNVNVGSNSTLTINAGTNATIGDFNVTITGTSGQIVKSQLVKVSVVQMLVPPRLTSITDQTVKPGETATVNVTVMDATNQMGLVLSLVNAPGYVTLTDNGNGNGVIRIAPMMGAQSGVVIVRATNAGGLTGQVMFNVTVPGSLMITNASFVKPTLTVLGNGFGTSGAIVRVNGVDVSSTINTQTDTKIELKGNKKKFALKKGQNAVTVTVGGATSNSFTFNF